MWIERGLFTKLVETAAQARGELAALQSRFAAQDAMVDWFRIRLTQTEKQNARLIKKYTDVDVEIPNLVPAPHEQTTPEILNEAAMFEDIGDEIAKKLGISHNLDGTISYSRKA